MKKLTFDPDHLMQSNLDYLSKLFEKGDYLSQPTVEKKAILDMLTTGITLMVNNSFTVTNIASEDDIVFIYVTDENSFTHRIYNGELNKKGKIIPISSDLKTDTIIDNEELENTLNIIINLFYFLFKMAYIKNTPYLHGLESLDPVEEAEESIEIESYINMPETDKILADKLKKG